MSDTRTGILIILDGFGVNPSSRYNAVAMAKKPCLDRLWKEYPHTTLEASESNVGLPRGFMGNSEVGHLNIGAGRVVYQDFSLISSAIEDGSFFRNEALVAAMKDLGMKHALHLIGLVSDGGVHSHLSHLFALIRMAKEQKVGKVFIHGITDGRDTSPTSGREFIQKLETFLEDVGTGIIATVSGRFFTMDRDSRWERTEKAYLALVEGKAPQTFKDATSYIDEEYRLGRTDEFIEPAILQGYNGISDGDSVLFFNFRADRARQLSHALTQTDFSGFKRNRLPVLNSFVSMTPYDDKLKVPTAFQKPKVPGTLGEWISKKGWKQLRIAETEKYAHVTYFFNGGEETPFPGEKRILVPSPREVKTYDMRPEMSARQVTDQLLQNLQTGEFRFAVVNFANPDMVGHTGSIPAATKAVEVVDECLGRIVHWVEAHKGFAILTADHGNCEKMIDDDGRPLTAHTLLPVPFVVIDPVHPDHKLDATGRLCDIAPSLCRLFGFPPPKEMTGKSLILS